MEGLVLEGVNEEQERHGSRLSWVVAESARGLVGRRLRPFWRAVRQAESRLSLLYGTLPVSTSVCLGSSLPPLSKFGVVLMVSHLSGTLRLRPASTGNFWIPEACPWERAPALSESVDLV